MKAALKRGIDMSQQRARQVEAADFERFDWLVVMDDENRRNLKNNFSEANHDKVINMMRFAPQSGFLEVPDPYYGQGDGFELVLDLLLAASEGLYEFLTQAGDEAV